MGRWRFLPLFSFSFPTLRRFPLLLYIISDSGPVLLFGSDEPLEQPLCWSRLPEQCLGAAFSQNKDRTSTVPAFFSVGVSCAVLVVWSRPVPARADRGSCGPARRAARDATAATGPSRSRQFRPLRLGPPSAGADPARALRRRSRVDSTLWRWPGWCFDCGRSGSSSWAY